MKKHLRKKYHEKRRQLSSEQIQQKSQQIAQHFLSSEWMNSQTFHVFLSIEKFHEVQTQFIISELWKQNKIVVVPKMNGKALLNCAYTPQTVLEIKKWDIPEPKTCELADSKQIDVVLMPLLICDQNGNRIGYGGGFYDRFLPYLREDVPLVGINFFEPIEHLEKEAHDIPLDALIIPTGVMRF